MHGKPTVGSRKSGFLICKTGTRACDISLAVLRFCLSLLTAEQRRCICVTDGSHLEGIKT